MLFSDFTNSGRTPNPPTVTQTLVDRECSGGNFSFLAILGCLNPFCEVRVLGVLEAEIPLRSTLFIQNLQVVAAWQQNFNQVIPINLFSQGRLAQQHDGIKQILELHYDFMKNSKTFNVPRL